MAIQNRRGPYGKLDKTKLLPGEYAIVLQDDPFCKDGRSVYICFHAGDTKRMATFEDMQENIEDPSLSCTGFTFVAKQLLPIFREYPCLWEVIPLLGNLPDNLTLSEYFDSWISLSASAEKFRKPLQKLAELFTVHCKTS